MTCESCGGPTEYLGVLGGFYWFRCKDCHWEMMVNEIPDAGTEDGRASLTYVLILFVLALALAAGLIVPALITP